MHPLMSHYAPFFFGVIELSSIPLVVVDVFSRFLMATPLKTLKQSTVSNALAKIFEENGNPGRCDTDGGKEFEGETEKMFEERGVAHSVKSKYGINNIRDLFGHKVDLQMIKTNPICRLGF